MSEARITFVDPSGAAHVISAPVGWTLMEAAVQSNVPGIVAECGGCCACATCHVIVEHDWMDALPPPETMESELLECTATPAVAGSRLGCQVRLTESLDGLKVTVAATQL
jgi:ferredoxin, 2Fe-2S